MISLYLYYKLKYLMKYLAIFTIALCIVSCKNTPKEQQVAAPVDASKTAALFELMQGSFNSNKQSIADTTYFDISLHMYPIWAEKGHYLYVEQALSSMQDKPYRQRIYHVTDTKEEGVYKSEVYAIPNDSLWIGKWKTPNAFDSLAIESLELRTGCAVYLKEQPDGSFTGETKPYTCESTLRGAAYATSVVTVTKNKIESWDQGFNVEGEQVWGATKGGYIFDRID